MSDSEVLSPAAVEAAHKFLLEKTTLPISHWQIPIISRIARVPYLKDAVFKLLVKKQTDKYHSVMGLGTLMGVMVGCSAEESSPFSSYFADQAINLGSQRFFQRFGYTKYKTSPPISSTEKVVESARQTLIDLAVEGISKKNPLLSAQEIRGRIRFLRDKAYTMASLLAQDEIDTEGVSNLLNKMATEIENFHYQSEI